MPNWVMNDLKITSPEAELERFMAECFTRDATELRFDFDKLIPMPATLKGWRPTLSLLLEFEGSVFPDWYLWSVENWGTKWNAHDTTVTRRYNGVKTIKLRFDTAWSIPWPIYDELAKRFPLLNIEGEIVELNMEFGGHLRCQGGKIDYEDKSEQIQAHMAEVYAELEREQATTNYKLTAGDRDDVPF